MVLAPMMITMTPITSSTIVVNVILALLNARILAKLSSEDSSRS
jgi:hypothetical protein